MSFQFKIKLKNISDPPVWRRLLVPEQFTFLRMHYLIQAAFGWDDYHLFQFSPKGYGSFPIIGIPSEEDRYHSGFEKTNEAAKVRLNAVFTQPKQKFSYIYDFGDDWKHEITLEKITDEKILWANILAGKGACPPEDCGGPWGYANLLNILDDSTHPVHNEMKEWLGLTKKQKWDAEAFDLEKTKKLVIKI